LHILGKLIETLAAQKRMLKLTLQKLLQEEFLMLHWSIDRTWWKSDSRITKLLELQLLSMKILLKKELLKF
jgi:hypothetical protein